MKLALLLFNWILVWQFCRVGSQPHSLFLSSSHISVESIIISLDSQPHDI